MDELEMAIRIAGYAAAVLGTCAAVPAATWRLVDGTRDAVRQVVTRLLRRPGPTQVVAVKSIGTFGFVGSATGKVIAKSGGTPEERLARLEQRTQELTDQQAKTRAELNQEIADRKRGDNELREHVNAETCRLNQRIDEEEQATVEVDARALLPIVLGAGLGTFPDVLASNALVGTGAISLALVLLFRAWYLLDSHRTRSTKA